MATGGGRFEGMEVLPFQLVRGNYHANPKVWSAPPRWRVSLSRDPEGVYKWAQPDSNQRPTGCKPVALAN